MDASLDGRLVFVMTVRGQRLGVPLWTADSLDAAAVSVLADLCLSGCYLTKPKCFHAATCYWLLSLCAVELTVNYHHLDIATGQPVPEDYSGMADWFATQRSQPEEFNARAGVELKIDAGMTLDFLTNLVKHQRLVARCKEEMATHLVATAIDECSSNGGGFKVVTGRQRR